MEDSSSNDEVDYVEETEYEENKFAASCPDCKADSKQEDERDKGLFIASCNEMSRQLPSRMKNPHDNRRLVGFRVN